MLKKHVTSDWPVVKPRGHTEGELRRPSLPVLSHRSNSKANIPNWYKKLHFDITVGIREDVESKIHVKKLHDKGLYVILFVNDTIIYKIVNIHCQA